MRRDYRMTARDKATELVRGYILEKGLKTGDRLPSERDMCEMWELNRTTLRNALRSLIEIGVLVSRVGSGTYVAPQKFVRNLQDTGGFSEAVRTAGRIPGTQVVSFAPREADKTISQRLHVPLGTPVFALCRLRTIDGTPAMLETTHVNAVLMPSLDSHDFSKESLFEVMRRGYGLVPTRGSEHLSVTQLDETESELLGVPIGSPAFFQTGVVTDDDRTPLEYFKAVVLSERVRFSCELVA